MSTQINLLMREFINYEIDNISLNEMKTVNGFRNKKSDLETISNKSPKGAQMIHDDWRNHL